ncbi:MAG: hypothetical protein ABR555_03945 [Pyrinomonadaceae bacterium]
MATAPQKTILIRLMTLVLIGMFSAPLLHAQKVQTPLPAPPPVKTVLKEERTQLETASNDPKKRVRLSIDLADAHITKAERYTEQSHFEEASSEVGLYHALIEDVLHYISTQKRDSNKTRDLYKRLELALRAHGPRLTSLRRTTPLEFAVRIKEVEDFARESRTKALNSFYGNTVVHEDRRSDAEKREKARDNPLAPKDQQP